MIRPTEHISHFVMLVAFLAIAWPSAFAAEEPPQIPIGLDAYRQWDRWPVQRLGRPAAGRPLLRRRS